MTPKCPIDVQFGQDLVTDKVIAYDQIFIFFKAMSDSSSPVDEDTDILVETIRIRLEML